VPPASPLRIDPEQIPAGGRKRMAALRPGPAVSAAGLRQTDVPKALNDDASGLER
jgi:hypothetical protein